MKKATRLSALTLAVIMLAILITGCGGGKPGNTATTPNGATTPHATTPGGVVDGTTATVVTDKNGYIADKIDPSINYNGQATRILYWKDVENPEYEVEELSEGNRVSDSIYNRNMKVQDRLGVELVFEATLGNYNNTSNFFTTLQTANTDSNTAYDIVSCYSMNMAYLTVNGMLQDMNGAGELDTTAEWWPAQLVESVTIGDRLYFLSGDISTNALYMMYVCYFNKDIAKKHDVEDLYSVVRSGEWTIDKMMEIGNGNIYEDIDGKAGKTSGDIFGQVGANLYSSTLYNSCGLTLIVNKDNKLTVSDDIAGDKTKVTDVADKLYGYFFETEYVWCGADETYGETDLTRSIFLDNRALFAINRADYAVKYLAPNSSSISYGILPLPKYDTEQTNYTIPMANPASFYGISSSCHDSDMAGTVLECLASEAYRNTTPEIFDLAMKVRAVENEDDSQMFDIIRKNIYFDLGVLLNKCLPTVSQISFAINKPESDFSTELGQKLSSYINSVDDLNMTISSLGQ